MSERCAECNFEWDMSVLNGLRIIDRLPRQAREVVSSMAEAAGRRPQSGGWSAGEYVWHLADTFRMSSEWLRDMHMREHPTHYAVDNDALAAARGYERLPVELGLWSLEESCRLFIHEAACIDPNRTCYYHDWKDVTAAQAVSFLIHEAVHHLYDLKGLAAREEASHVI